MSIHIYLSDCLRREKGVNIVRILLIDDDQGFKDALEGDLIETFPGEFAFVDPLLDLEPLQSKRFDFASAWNTLKDTLLVRASERIDIALVDRNLKGGSDRNDTSGDKFAIGLQKSGIPSVLVTAIMPSDQQLFEYLRKESILGCVNKSLPELLGCLIEFKLSHRFPNCVAGFRWKGRPLDEIFTEKDWIKVRQGVDEGLPDWDFAVLFRSLIPACARDVELKSIARGHGGASLFRATISFGDGPVKEELAIKYGTRRIIHDEALRYDRFVGPLPDGVAAQLKWRKETEALGALAYSWVSDSTEDAQPLGPVDSRLAEKRTTGPNPSPSDQDAKPRVSILTWRRRRAAVDRLFSVSLNPWYEIYRKGSDKPPKPISLKEYYVGEGLSMTRIPFASQPLPADLPGKVVKHESQWDFGSLGTYADPAEWLNTGRGSTVKMDRCSPCHGDLHVKNIFVLPDDSPRLIDFGDTDLGHVFRDFVALEASLRMTCCNTTSLKMLAQMTDLASRTTALGEHIQYRDIPDHDEHEDLREVLRMVTQIRRAASDAAGDNDTERNFDEYLVALALRFLRYAGGEPDGKADEVPSAKETSDERGARRWHALYASAKAVEQAERVHKSGNSPVNRV
jgi:hypothetical protein